MAVIAAGASSCKPPPKAAAPAAPATPEAPAELVQQLSGARIDTAKIRLQQQDPGQALALLVSALKADPASEEARRLIGKILAETSWSLPEITLDHGSVIEQIAFSAPSTLWVSHGGKTNTSVRWDLGNLKIESVLFPTAGVATRSLTFDPGQRVVVIQRGTVTLLCDARTLKPIRAIENPPDFLTHSAVIVFSDEGLLLAHPAFASETDRSIVWHLRDTATGEVIRTSDPAPPGDAQPLAASLDRKRLRVIHADGSLLEMPVSPVELSEKSPLPDPARLLQAQFSADGNAVLARIDQGPHEPAVRSVISYDDTDDGSLETEALMRRFPWSRHPNLWSGLMTAPDPLPFEVVEGTLKILNRPHSPIQVKSPITAIAFTSRHVITGEENGRLTLHRLLPPAGEVAGGDEMEIVSEVALASLDQLAESLSGIRYDEKERSFGRIELGERVAAFAGCDFSPLRQAFPKLDFSALTGVFREIKSRTADASKDPVLQGRLARATTDEPSAMAAASEIRSTFESGDNSRILKAISEAGGKGPAAATALALALQSDEIPWLEACVAAAQDLPPLLRRIAASRIAWLDGRKADALSGWPEVLPELAEIRLREDWDGWEQADFEPALQSIRQWIADEITAIAVPENPTAEQRKILAERLKDPATLAAVGRARFAQACLNAALAFSAHKEETETTFQLAKLARDLGAAPAPCLRAEALALTALGDHERAHPRWIELITEHPVETHLPGDYAEAAYTAYENADSRQAMEILTTGLHRFPRDGNFALRAGWVALLTGNSERAYQFLLEGKRIGYPPEKHENATALLTIAAEQVGATDDATVYFRDLLDIDPAWSDASILETLEWPEELKMTLRQFMH